MAPRANGSLVQIDSGRLGGLTLEHHVGVTAASVEVPDLDTDFLEVE